MALLLLRLLPLRLLLIALIRSPLGRRALRMAFRRFGRKRLLLWLGGRALKIAEKRVSAA